MEFLIELILIKDSELIEEHKKRLCLYYNKHL